MEKWMETARSPRERAELLLREMTLREKVGQLNQRLLGFRVCQAEGGLPVLSEEFMKEVEDFGSLGFLYGLLRADPWSERTFENGLTGGLAPAAANAVQRYVMEHTRLHIPVMLTMECPHGNQMLDGYLLPTGLGMGASFDPDLVRAGFAEAGRQLKRSGIHMGLVSMFDICRDPRWGRSEECYGEDPYLAAELAKAAVTGMHEGGVLVCGKHFAAQGGALGGCNAGPVPIGGRELGDIHLPAAKAAVEAGVDAVMAAYNEIDGIPCHANPALLDGLLRETWGFAGIVMADGTAVDQLASVAGGLAEAGALALSSGVDVSLWDRAYAHLEEAAERGLVSEEKIDRAVLRVLELKFRSGLFDHPFGEAGEESAEAYVRRDEARKDPSLALAEESVVLLKNTGGILPFSPAGLASLRKGTVAVIGPNADDKYAQLGDYTPPMRDRDCVTIRQGFEQVFGKDRVIYSKGSGLRERDEVLLAKAKALAAQAPFTVLVLGSSSSRFGDVDFLETGAADRGTGSRITMDCGEGRDVSDLRLPEAQRELFAAVRSKTKKLITVILSGRPLVLSDIDSSDCILQCFYPGPKGGLAVAEIAAGLINPSGALPVSLPASAGQLPCCYNQRGLYPPMRYLDGKDSAYASFGDGTDYSAYRLSKVRVQDPVLSVGEAERGTVLTCSVKNVSGRAGTALLLAYAKGEGTGVTPRKKLCAFARVPLEAGEEREVSLSLGAWAFSAAGPDGCLSVKKGHYTITLVCRGREEICSAAVAAT